MSIGKRLIEPLQSVGMAIGVATMCVFIGAGYTVHQLVVAPLVFITTGRAVFSKKEIEKFYGVRKQVKPV